MAEICLRVLDGFAMPVEWALCIVVPIFKGKGDIRNCSCYEAVKFLEHGMKVVERVLENGFVEWCLLMKCNLTLCMRKEQLMLRLS